MGRALGRDSLSDGSAAQVGLLREQLKDGAPLLQDALGEDQAERRAQKVPVAEHTFERKHKAGNRLGPGALGGPCASDCVQQAGSAARDSSWTSALPMQTLQGKQQP